jgi:hypothetical protein
MTTWGGHVLLSTKIGMRPELFFYESSFWNNEMYVYEKEKRHHQDLV